MHTLFLSDLHLTPERPAVTAAFLHFLEHQAPHADKIYLLGDLFEFWIGDDAASMLGAEPILRAMHEASQRTECFFIAGNRDFLVRDTFSQQSGFTILPDETVIDLYGTATLLLHGDSLCTDDVAHQQFRSAMMTNSHFCDAFLTLSIPERIAKAKEARLQSYEHKSAVSMEIMDVTESAVRQAFDQHSVKQMIHGHTHRQHVHHYQIDGGPATRYVLGDWHSQTSVLTADKDGLTIQNQAIPND
ncbi:UDP-2,3-diacylglucosamine diphosphatase [Arenicella xantha]|nr:UDP-2,3-diacylglucosamine diphosphatase [Arenicella xantha]